MLINNERLATCRFPEERQTEVSRERGRGGNCMFYKTGSTVILRASPEFAVFVFRNVSGKTPLIYVAVDLELRDKK